MFNLSQSFKCKILAKKGLCDKNLKWSEHTAKCQCVDDFKVIISNFKVYLIHWLAKKLSYEVLLLSDCVLLNYTHAK